MLIRSATEADVLAVLPMVAKICALHQSWDSAKYGFLPNPEKRYEKWLLAQVLDQCSVFLVAETSEPLALVAFLIATTEREIPIYTLREYGFIHDLWVEPDYRKLGLARQMVTLAVERFSAMGIKQIRLDTAAINTNARHLFESCGFRSSTIEMLISLD